MRLAGASAVGSTVQRYGAKIANPCTPAVAAGCLIDDTLAGATTAANSKSGYFFTYVQTAGTPSIGYTINGDPAVVNQSGVRGFFSDASGVIRGANPAPASATSTPI